MRRWLQLAVVALSAFALVAPVRGAIAYYADEFDRADENPLSGWTKLSGSDLKIVSNQVLAANAGNNSFSIYDASGALTDAWVRVTIKSFSDAGFAAIHAALRMPASGTASGYLVGALRNSGGNTTSLWDFAGSTEIGGNTSATWAANDVLTGIVRGQQVTAFRNNGFVIGGTSATTANGRVGVGMELTNAVTSTQADDWLGGDLPIEYVGAGSEAEAASGNLTLNLPSSLRIHDLVLCFVHSSDQVSHSMGSEWTQVAQGNGGSTTSRLSVWKHRYMGAAPSSTTLSHSSGSGIIAGCAAWRSPKGLVDIDVQSSIGTGTDGTMEAGTVTPTQALGILLHVAGSADDNARTAIAGYLPVFEDSTAGTQNAYVGTAGATDEGLSVYMRDSMPAATGTITVTMAASDPWAAMQIALLVKPLNAPLPIALRLPFFLPRRAA